jgi:hypothetical protein
MGVLMTIVRQVESWYAKRKEYLSTLFLAVQIDSTEPDHLGGEIGIGIETLAVIANISIFNSGLITIPAVDKISGKEFVLDHREIAPDEDLAMTLDRYVEQITSPK